MDYSLVRKVSQRGHMRHLQTEARKQQTASRFVARMSTVARTGHLNPEIAHDFCRTFREHHDSVGKEKRFIHIVRNQYDGLPRAAPESEKFSRASKAS